MGTDRERFEAALGDVQGHETAALVCSSLWAGCSSAPSRSSSWSPVLRAVSRPAHEHGSSWSTDRPTRPYVTL